MQEYVRLCNFASRDPPTTVLCICSFVQVFSRIPIDPSHFQFLIQFIPLTYPLFLSPWFGPRIYASPLTNCGAATELILPSSSRQRKREKAVEQPPIVISTVKFRSGRSSLGPPSAEIFRLNSPSFLPLSSLPRSPCLCPPRLISNLVMWRLSNSRSNCIYLWGLRGGACILSVSDLK